MFTVSINPALLHIVGPFSIHIYGIFMALGIITVVWLTYHDPLRKKIMPLSLYEHFITYIIIIALLGARILHIASEWHSYTSLGQALSLWNGGLSILGALMGGLIATPLFLWFYKIPVLPVLDIAARYLPLSQAIARLGCLFAGCCFGAHSDIPWAVIYTHAGSHAPLGLSLHPAQLYSSAIFFAMFLAFRVISKKNYLFSGQLAALYIFFSGCERFIVDFFRGDRIINSSDAIIRTTFLSFHQWLSLFLMIIGIALFLKSSIKHFKKNH